MSDQPESPTSVPPGDSLQGAAPLVESGGPPSPPPSPAEHAGIPSLEAPPEDSEPDLLPFPIVAIGASAGGLEAFRELLGRLTPDSGMAYVLLTHLAPDQKSHLVEILGATTAIPVASVEDDVKPEPDHLYVLPPNTYASFKRGRFVLEPRPEGERVPMPIDHFFRSLAADQKTRAIGVILSGADHDGALGLKTIKSEGGIAIVQTPESSRHSGMPRASIAAEHVDLVLPPGEIGAELSRLGTQFGRPDVRRLDDSALRPPTGEHLLGRILGKLSAASGIDFRQYKPATLQRRIARRMMLNRVGSLQEYVRFVEANPAEVRDLQEDALINVTNFFRDPEVWEALKNDVLPRIFETRPDDRQVRVWVPGCATGEEAYSIAICLLEFAGGRSSEPPMQVFGTDASERMVQLARAGAYSETIAGDMSPERLHHFFTRTDKGYQINKRVRDLCIFARQNLSNDPPFSRLDMISCRNVLIYFNQSLQKQILPTFHYALRDGGYLLLGSSETLREYSSLFTLVDRRCKFYLKKPVDNPVALDFSRGPVAVPVDGGDAAARPEDGWSDAEIQRAADRIVLARYGPAGVVVNERLEILQSRGHTGDFLEMSPGSSSLQLTRMLRESIANQVRDAVRRSIAEDMPVRIPDLEVRNGDQSRTVAVEVLPIQSVHLHRRCYLVLFVPAPERHGGPASVVEAAPELAPDEKDRIVSQLRKDLASNRLYLQSLIEERDVKNQDLISANEEIQSANEELQSANEELETTKEEIQSANEELQTVNEELNSRNAALAQAGNDLNNLLTSVNIPVLMLNSNMEIRQFTPLAQRLMNVRPSDIGRPVSEIRHNLNVDDLRPLVREVLESLTPRELEVQDREGRWYLLRVRPYRTSDNRIEGTVLVLLDIDQLRGAQEQLRAARDFALGVIESLHVPAAVLDTEMNIRTVNGAFRSLSGMAARELEGHFFPDVVTMLWGLNALRPLLEALRNDDSAPAGFEIELESRGAEPRVFGVRGRVLRANGDRIILVTMDEVTERRKLQRAQSRERAALEAQIRSATQALDRSRKELRALTDSLFRSLEDERRRVARELHDDISQKLALLDMDMQEVAARMAEGPEAARARMEALRQRTGLLSEEVRVISRRLHPSILDDLGLSSALRALVEEFGRREHMLATFSSRDVPESLPLETSANLYRITQEALRNVAKHAGRTHVKVTLEGRGDRIRLEVVDLGNGFDTEDVRGGLGLISMAERARLMGGVCSVQSALGKGATVAVEAPLTDVVR